MTQRLTEDERRWREYAREERRARAKVERAAARFIEVMAENRVQWGSGELLLDTLYVIEEAHYDKYGQPPPRPATSKKRPKPPTSAKTLELLGIACVKCGSTDRVALDHIVPVIAGGVYAKGNVQPLCRSCNSKKGGRQ